MFTKEIDEIYNLAKQAAEEGPDALVSFQYTSRGLHFAGLKNSNDLYSKSQKEFRWDVFAYIYRCPELEEISKKGYLDIKAFLLELLIDGKCPNE